MRRRFPWAAIVAALLVGRAIGAPADDYRARVTELGAPIRTVVVYDGGFGRLKDGAPIAAFVVKGSPGILHVLDIRTREVVFKAPLPGTDEGSWSVTVARDGTVYAGGTAGNLYRWREGGHVELLGGKQGVLYGPVEAPNGDMYVGHWPSGHLMVWRQSTSRLEDLGAAMPGESYVRSLAVAGNSVYLGIGAHPHLVRYDILTNKFTAVPLPKSLITGDAHMVVGLTTVAGRLFGAVGDNIFVMDLKTQKVIQTIPNAGGDSSIASPPYKGKTYLGVRNGLVEYDLASNTWKPLSYPTPGAGKRDYIWAPMRYGIPHLVSVTWDGGIWAFSPDLKKYDSWKMPLEGQPIPIQTMETGPDGNLYMSGYPGGMAARWDLSKGESEMFPMGQAEGMGFVDNTIYFGIYPTAYVTALDTTKPLKATTKVLDIGNEQDRPFGWATDGKTLFIGTVSTYGKLGGALTVFTPSTGEHQTFRNLIPNQSIIRLAYRDGLVYGATTVWGGLGEEPTEKAARLFVWNPSTRELVREAAVESPLLKGAPKAINGLVFGPDGNLWVAWQGTLAVVNPRTLKVERAKELRPSNWNLTHSWENVDLVWGRDGMLYAALDGQISAVDPATLEVTPIQRAGQIAEGADGNLYFTASSMLYRLDVPAS